MNSFNILKTPVISEKSTDRRDDTNQYTFIVDVQSDKKGIINAISKQYDVKVESVRTLIRPGKIKRRGRTLYKSKPKKFAFIKLAEGQKLPLFEEG